MPSHASLFTGLYPPAHGVRDNGTAALSSGVVTLAQRLGGAGYTTHAFVSAVVLSRLYGLDAGFASYDDDLWAEDAPRMFMIRERPARRTADRFLEWFERWKADRRDPFFAWVHFFDPHQPLEPALEDRVGAASLYDAEVTAADRATGRVIDALRTAGVLDDTIVIVTADHGESLGEHGEATHAIFVYDATVRVPFIVRYPAALPAGRVYEGPVRLVDVMPTVLGWLGLAGRRADPGRRSGRGVEGQRAAAAAGAIHGIAAVGAGIRHGAAPCDPQGRLQVDSRAAIGALRSARRSGRAHEPASVEGHAPHGDRGGARQRAGSGAAGVGAARRRARESDDARDAGDAAVARLSRAGRGAAQHGGRRSEGRHRDLQPPRRRASCRAGARLAEGGNDRARDPRRRFPIMSRRATCSGSRRCVSANTTTRGRRISDRCRPSRISSASTRISDRWRCARAISTRRRRNSRWR